MSFQKGDNVKVVYYDQTTYVGVVDSCPGDDPKNPTSYKVKFKAYWGKNSKGEDELFSTPSQEPPYKCEPSQLSANPSRSGTGFVQGS